MGLKMILIIAVIILILLYLNNPAAFKAKADELFNKYVKEKSQSYIQQKYNGTEQTNYGKIPCKLDSECKVFSQTALCNMQTGECLG